MNITSKLIRKRTTLTRIAINNKGAGSYSSNTDRNTASRLIHLTLKYIHFFTLVLMLFWISGYTAEAARLIDVGEGAQWHYFKGTKKPPHHWTHIGFNLSSWQKGSTGLGYGHASVKTLLHDMRGKYKKVHARREFSIANPKNVNKIFLSLECDGAFAAYINGIEVIRNSVGLSVPGQSPQHAAFQKLDISGFSDELLPGTNVLSVQCENDDINSEDFSFTPVFEVQGQ